MRRHRIAVRVIALGLLLPALLLPGRPASATTISSFDLPDAAGLRHTLAETRGSKAVVFLFLGTDCPLSNRYAPELSRLFSEYSARGVVFYAVHSDPSVGAGDVQKHARDFHYPFPVLVDATQTLARQTGAAATPEVAVVSPAGKLLYRGRIDDRVADFGKNRQRPARQDLRLALSEILDGKPVAQPITKAIGCAIPFARQPQNDKVTFTRDIAPLLYKRCASCHHDGGAAPFPLLSYRDAAKRASLIAKVTASRYMPPWKPEPGYGRFEGERRLAVAEIAAIREWADAGAPEGDPALLPVAPKFPEGWELGRPDLVAKMPALFSVAADGPDVYQCFVIPLGVAEDKYVRAVEFEPGNRKLVHHALFFVDASGAARRRAAGETQRSYPCFGVPGFLPTNSLGGWSPGNGPIRLPEGAPAVLRKGGDLVLQIHFHPTGKPEQDQSSLGLYFTDKPPEKKVADVALGSNRIDIPAGDTSYKVTDHFTLPIDVEAIGIIPHAHYLCKEMKGWAVPPNGKKQWLIWIRDWDFNWQEEFRYEAPLRLPEGTRLEMEFTYDNSEGNPRNPNRPPKRVVWGPDTTDEMAGLHVQVMPERMSDLPTLSQALWGKFMRTVGGKFYQRQ